MADKLPLADFAAKIKAKYPEYKDVEDSVLVDRILKKYPQYTGAVDYKLKKKVGGEDLQTGAENSLPTPTFDESNAQYAQIAEDAILRDQAKQNFPVNLGIEQQPQTGFGTSITGQGLTKQEVLTGAKPDWHGAQSQRLAELHAGWQAANPDIEAPMRLMQEIESNRPQVREAIPESGLKRTKDRSKIIYNSLLDGIGSLITEATDLGLQFQALTQQAGQGAIAETNLNNFRKNLAPSFRSALTDVIGANLSDNTINRYKNETVTAALSGVAASVPAMVGSRLRTVRFFLQGADAAMQSLYENDTNDDLSNIEKTVYSSLVGLASAYLEKAGFDKIFKTNTNQVAAYIANKTLADAAKSGKKITGDALTQFLNQNLSEASNRFVRTGVRGIEGFITEGLTGSAQEAATIGAEYGLNAIKGKEIFDLEGLDSAVARIGEAGFLEAIGGGVLGGVSGIISGAKRNAVYKNIKAINKIDSMLDNEELSDETKESLIKMKISLGKQIESDLQVSLEDFNKLSKKAQDEIRALNEEAASNQEVIDDPNVDEEIKKTAEERVKQIDTQINDIVKEDAKRPKEAADINLDELPDDVREEIDQKNQRIQEINIEKARLRSEGEVQSDRIGALNEEERRLYEEINQLAQAERAQDTAQPSEQVEEAQKSETSKDLQPSTDNLSPQQNEESTQLPADSTEGSSKVSLGGQDAAAQPVVEEKPKAKRDRKADASQPVEEDRDTKLLRDSYNRLTEGMTPEQIEADPDLVRMRDRIGQSSETQENVSEIAIPSYIKTTKGGRNIIRSEDVATNFPKFANRVTNKFSNAAWDSSDIRDAISWMLSQKPRYANGMVDLIESLVEAETLLSELGQQADTISKSDLLSKIGANKNYSQQQKDVLSGIVDRLHGDRFFDFTTKPVEGSTNGYVFSENLLAAKDPDAFIHEVGHWGFYNLLSPKDRVEYLNYVKNRFYGTGRAMSSDLAISRVTLSDGSELSTNSASNFSEYFAEQFRQYVLTGVSDPDVSGLFARFKQYLNEIITLFRSKGYNTDLKPFFDKIIAESAPTTVREETSDLKEQPKNLESQQTQEETSNAVQERKTKEVPLDEPSGDSEEVGGKVRKQTEAREKPVVKQKPTKQEVEVKPVTDADLPKKNGQVKQVAVAPDIQAKITMSESLDGEPIFVVQMESDGKVIVDKNGDDTYEFVSAKDAVKFINSKQRGYKLPKGESAKKADDTPSSTPKKGSLPVPKHLEIADYEFSYDIDEDGKYQIYEQTTEIGIGPKFDSAEEVVEFWEKNKYKVTSSGVEAAIRANKKGIDIVSQWRDKKKEGQRIKPAKEEPTGPVTPIGKMIGTLADKLNATIIYSKPGSKRAAGTYNPRNTLITIRNAGDIDTVAHEVGHYIDDAFGVLNTAPKESDNEIKWFYDRGGSNPPDSFSKQQKKEYLRREGIGEFIRAYIVNPKGAKEKAPVLYEHIKNTIPKEVIDAIEEFSREVRNYYNSSASDKMLANVELVPLPDKKGFLEWLSPKGEPNELVFDWRDSLTSKIFEGLHMARKAYNFATKLSGTPDLLGVSLFDIYARTFAGVNGKINSIFKKGMIDINGKLLKDKDGNRMTMKWLFEPLEGDTVEDVERASHDVIKLLIAERTKEYAKKFGRDDELTGIGGGLETDLDVAENYLKEFDEMAKADPVYAKAIREAANRYRQYAESALKYYYDAGRLSEDSYKAIKDGNEFYVSLARVKEVGPEEESLNIGRLGPRANLGAVREALRKSKGGTRKIKNPYLSLLENVNNMIHEADRNMVMQKFVEPLRSTRKMGENEARNLAQIGAKVNESGDNTITIYANGHKEIWKFDVEVYKALKALENITPNLALKIMSLPGTVLRFTVTTAPPFAARNVFRDTVSRLILSNNNSKLFDMFYNDEDKRLFEVYGGSQAGHYITSRKAYYTMMRDTMSEVARKNVLLDPRKIGRIADRYYRFLESAENVNRIAEFKAAYEKAKKAGLPDREAGMYAAYQARDLLDFAVAGHWIKVLNQIIPFTNAAIQGLRRAGRHMKDKPLQFAGRLAVYSVLPTLIERALVYSTGDDDEYNKLPYWQRDLYWNFKIPMLTDKWISIPKPFELGIPGSFVSRAISKSLGDEKAYDGFFKSTAELLVPVDESVVLMGWKPLIEVMMNHDMFRQKPIIPVWEQHLKLSKREGTKYSSSLGKMLSQTLGYAGVEVDPRNVDHIVKGFFSTYGDYALRLSNWIGRNEYSQKFNLAEMTSFVKERPIANGRDVLAVYELAARNGKTQSAPVKRLKKMVREYYDANGVKERKEAAIRIYKYAEKVRADLERLDKNN